MNERVKQVLQEAQQLDPTDRLELIRYLLLVEDAHDAGDSADIDAEWLAEANRRWEQHKASGAGTYDAFESIEKMRERLAKRRQG